jgi:hypothetical protein
MVEVKAKLNCRKTVLYLLERNLIISYQQRKAFNKYCFIYDMLDIPDKIPKLTMESVYFYYTIKMYACKMDIVEHILTALHKVLNITILFDYRRYIC